MENNSKSIRHENHAKNPADILQNPEHKKLKKLKLAMCLPTFKQFQVPGFWIVHVIGAIFGKR